MESARKSRFSELLREAEKEENLDGLHDAVGEDALGGYTSVVTAAFIEAVDRRLGTEHRDDAAVAAFIGGVRSRFPGADEEIDPAAAERVVRKALGRGSVSDIDGPAIRHIERLLLPLMVADAHYSDEDLDRFLAGARKLLGS